MKNKNTLDGISDSYLKWRFITEVNGMKMQYTGACFTKHYSEPTDQQKRNLNVTHLQCFDVFLAFLETIFRLLKDENKTRLNSKKKIRTVMDHSLFIVWGGRAGGRLLRRVLGFKGGKLGDQSSLTELKGEDIKKLTD